MKLYVRHTFDCTPETFWKMYWDDEFDQMLRKDATVERELVSERSDGDVSVRRLRFTPEQELPGPVAKLIGSKKLIYEQENRFNPVKGEMHWEVVPTFLPGKLSAKGVFLVRPSGAGCERIVDGNIAVNVRFIGGQIEKAVVAEIVQSYDKTVGACHDWLERYGNS